MKKSSVGVTIVVALFFNSPVFSQSGFSPDEKVDVRVASVKSEGLMFGLSALAAPLCQKDRLAWGLGPPWLRVWPEATTSKNLSEQGRALKKRFPVADNDRVFIATPVLTPYAEAGILAGDTVSAESSGLDAPLEPRDTWRARTFAALEANPVRTLSLTRGTEKLEVQVKHRLTCLATLTIKKSRNSYADSSKAWGVIVTEPLVKTLTYRQQAIVFAHEMAQLATGGVDANDGTGALIGGLILGRLSAFATNTETGYWQPKPDQMQEADTVALWLLAQLSISPQEYLDEMIRLDTESSSLSGAAYSTTRGLSGMRKTTIENWVNAWKADGSLPMPKSYNETMMQQFKSHTVETGLIKGIKTLIAEGQQIK